MIFATILNATHKSAIAIDVFGLGECPFHRVIVLVEVFDENGGRAVGSDFYFKIVVIVPLVCISLECVSQQGLP